MPMYCTVCMPAPSMSHVVLAYVETLRIRAVAVDQPVGTGFSYASTSAYAKSLPQAADEVRYFMERFVEVYPEYAAGNGVDVYIAGES